MLISERNRPVSLIFSANDAVDRQNSKAAALVIVAREHLAQSSRATRQRPTEYIPLFKARPGNSVIQDAIIENKSRPSFGYSSLLFPRSPHSLAILSA
jgi:hypothetical protein